jgi:hypothetical protein
MYDFLTKKKLKMRALVGHIPVYRAMLSERRVPASGWVAVNPQELAEDLLYILLDYYSIEEIEARASGASPAAEHFRESTKKSEDTTGIAPVKKKFLNSRNIRISAGKTWTTLSSAWRTASSRIASAAGSVFKSSKN